MFKRFDQNPIKAIVWTILFIAMMAGARTVMHWSEVSSGKQTGIILQWIIVGLIMAVFGMAFLRLVQRRRAQSQYISDERIYVIETKATPDQRPEEFDARS